MKLNHSVNQWIISLMCNNKQTTTPPPPPPPPTTTINVNGLTVNSRNDYHIAHHHHGHHNDDHDDDPDGDDDHLSLSSKSSTSLLTATPFNTTNIFITFQLILLIIFTPWINCDSNGTNIIIDQRLNHRLSHLNHHHHSSLSHHHHQHRRRSPTHVNRVINRRESIVTKQGCPKKCECIWRGGKYEVDCKGLTFTKIPTEIHSDTQVINFNGNRIKTLEPKIFQTTGLINLQKIYLSNCSLKKIPGDSFASLSNLVELDLSYNYLETIPDEALRDSRSLRRLHLNSNPIKKIDPSSFVHLTSLQLLDLSNCAISSIHQDSFLGLEKLNYLFLNGNKLRELSGSILKSLISLKQINLHENHWFCDCRILDLRSGLSDRSISITVPPICDKPIRLRGASWQNLDQDEFACSPKIISLTGAKFIEGRNGTLTCRVQSTPRSNISWYFESPIAADHLISNATYMSFGKQYITIRETVNDNMQISKLTITNTIEKDSGRYTCYASNKAGNVSSSVVNRVIQPENSGEESLVLSEKDEQIGIILATILVFLLLVLSACFIVLRHKTSFLSNIFKSSRSQSEVIESNVILGSAYSNHNSKSPIANNTEHDQKRCNPNHLQTTKSSTGLTAKDTIVITQPNGSVGFASDTLVKVFQPDQQPAVENNNLSPDNSITTTIHNNKSLDESGFDKCLESYLMMSEEDTNMLLPSRTDNPVDYNSIIQQNDQQLTQHHLQQQQHQQQQPQQTIHNWGQDVYDQSLYSMRSLNRRYSDSSASLMVKQLNVNSPSVINNSRVTIREDSIELLPRNDQNVLVGERFRSRRLSEGIISDRINGLWNRNCNNNSISNQHHYQLPSSVNIHPNEDYNNWTVGDSGHVVVNGDSNNYYKGGGGDNNNNNFIGSEKDSLLRRNGYTNVDYSTLQAPRRCSKSGLTSQLNNVNNTPGSNYLRALSLEDTLNPTFPVIHESSKEYESDIKN